MDEDQYEEFADLYEEAAIRDLECEAPDTESSEIVDLIDSILEDFALCGPDRPALGRP